MHFSLGLILGKQVARAFTPKVVTANDLLEGDVIYFNANNKWVRALSDAAILTELEEANALLAIAAKDIDSIVGAYLADVKIDNAGKPVPAHFREEFRTKGPSNYFHGKQTESNTQKA